MSTPEPREPQAMTTAGLEAKVDLRWAWFKAHPNQPMSEGREQVDRLIADIEAEAVRDAERRQSVPVPALDATPHGWIAGSDVGWRGLPIGSICDRLMESIAGERRFWMRVEVAPDDLSALLEYAAATQGVIAARVNEIIEQYAALAAAPTRPPEHQHATSNEQLAALDAMTVKGGGLDVDIAGLTPAGAAVAGGAANFDAAVQRAFAGSGVQVRTSFTGTEPLSALDAAREVVRLAEPDEQDGEYVDYIVPADAIDKLREALRDAV